MCSVNVYENDSQGTVDAIIYNGNKVENVVPDLSRFQMYGYPLIAAVADGLPYADPFQGDMESEIARIISGGTPIVRSKDGDVNINYRIMGDAGRVLFAL